MKRLLVTLSGVFSLVATLPALAGPDWVLIDKAHKDRRQAALAPAGQASMPVPSASRLDCPPPSLVLPLAHGPRALTTPAMNQVRKARHEARVKACQEAQR